MTPEMTSLRGSQTKTICASSTMAPPLTWNHRLSIHRTQCQPLIFPSAHLASLLNVHGRSFLTHMVVITIRSWYPCLLLLETRTRVVIPVTWCSQRLTGSNLQSCAWTRSLVISSMTKTPSPHLLGSSSMLQQTASQGQPQSPKNPTLGLMKNAGKCWRLGGPSTEKSTEEGGLGWRHSCPSDEDRHRPDDYLPRKKR